MMMRHRRGTSNSPTSTICYDDVETCYSSPAPRGEVKTKRRRGSSNSRCSKKVIQRVVHLALIVTVGIVGWRHFKQAYTLYNLPGVKDLLKGATTVLGDEYVVFLSASTGEPGETYVKMICKICKIRH